MKVTWEGIKLTATIWAIPIVLSAVTILVIASVV